MRVRARRQLLTPGGVSQSGAWCADQRRLLRDGAYDLSCSEEKTRLAARQRREFPDGLPQEFSVRYCIGGMTAVCFGAHQTFRRRSPAISTWSSNGPATNSPERAVT